MNVMMLLDMAAGDMPERTAVGPRSNGMTYARLFELAARTADRLRASAAMSMVVCDESNPAMPVALFGAAWAGLPYVPLNYRLPDDDLRALCERATPALALTAPADADRLVSVADLDLLEQADFLIEAAEPADSLDSAKSAEPGSWEMDPEAIAVLLFTSGTSGPPKAAVLRHRHLVSYVIGSVDFGAAGDDETSLISVPPYHIAGVIAMLSAVYAGRRFVQLPRFDPNTWIDLVRAEGVTHAMVVPTMLTQIVDALDARGGEPVVGVRTLAYGGGRMARSVVERALELFPETGFVNSYGLTETSSTISVLGPDDHRTAQASEDDAVRARLSSVGHPLPGIELSVRADSGDDAQPGATGEIWVRGQQVAGEYLEQGSMLDDDGWFPTRDSGFLDAEGFLHLTGRVDDVIVRGGENMSPGEIEDVLLEHPAVKDAAAVGIPSREWGEKVLIVVVTDDANDATNSLDSVELCELIRSRLRSSRVPEHVEFVDELPYNETGKLLRRELRERFAHLAEEISSAAGPD